MYVKVMLTLLVGVGVALVVLLVRGGPARVEDAAAPPAVPLSLGPLGSDERSAAVYERLNQPVPEVTFDSVTLRQAVAMLAELAEVNIVVDWEAFGQTDQDAGELEDPEFLDDPEAPEIPEAPKVREAVVDFRVGGVTLWAALKAAFWQAGFGGNVVITVDEGLVLISTPEAVGNQAPTVMRVYDVRDLLDDLYWQPRRPDRPATREQQPPPPAADAAGGRGLFGPMEYAESDGTWRNGAARAESLANLVDDYLLRRPGSRRASGSGAYGGGSAAPAALADVHEWSGRIVVVDTVENHRRVEYLLQLLRQEAARGARTGVAGPKRGAP